GSLARPEFSANERHGPKLLQLWQERERQQHHQRWTLVAERPDRPSSVAPAGWTTRTCPAWPPCGRCCCCWPLTGGAARP
ncbi:hypothetical protein E2320_022318, partial [Naja naja]